WNQTLDSHGNLVEPLGRDDVVRKLGPDQLPVDVLHGKRIVNHAFQNGIAERILAEVCAGDGPGEVARARGRGGDGDGGVVDVKKFAVLLPVIEEESPVLALVHLGNPHRTADVKTVIVAADALYGVDERRGSVKGVIRQVIIARAVILIGAGAHGDIE